MRGSPLIGPTSLVTNPVGGGAEASARPAMIAWLASGLLGSAVPRPTSSPEPRPYAFLFANDGETAFWNSLLIGCVSPAVFAAAPEKARSAFTRRLVGFGPGSCRASACTSVPVLYPLYEQVLGGVVVVVV